MKKSDAKKTASKPQEEKPVEMPDDSSTPEADDNSSTASSDEAAESTFYGPDNSRAPGQQQSSFQASGKIVINNTHTKPLGTLWTVEKYSEKAPTPGIMSLYFSDIKAEVQHAANTQGKI